MSEVECPGLPASWFNAWLAAVGTTVLVPQMRLSWTDGPASCAVLSLDAGTDLFDALGTAWPDAGRISAMPIARRWRDTPNLKRKPALVAFQERARAGRGQADVWTLSSTVTDLYVTDKDAFKATVSHSRLDPPVPRGLTIHDRLMALAELAGDATDLLRETFAGRGIRSNSNGLGFDITRLTAQGDNSSNRVDVAVEVLAFFGMALFPVRGAGVIQGVSGAREALDSRVRCWHQRDDGRTRQMFWPAWSSPIHRPGIDALLDAWQPRIKSTWSSLSIHAGWRSVEYKGRGQNDSTKGIGSEAL